MMKNQIPITLIYTRLFIGVLIFILSIYQIENYKYFAIILLTIGLLTDIFDGIIARRLKISTQKLRRLDSNIDQIFFLLFIGATYFQCPDFFKLNLVKLIIVLCFEGLTYLISFLKFRKEIATHTIGAKIWTLFLFATLIEIILTCQSTILFNLCFWIGLITRIEIMAIIFSLKEWTNDVPTIYHSLKLRNGKPIKRHKLFNG